MYRPSPRRPTQILGGFPELCVLRKADPRGVARFDEQRVYVTMALAGFDVGLRPMQRYVEVWFHDVLLGRFAYGTGRTTVEPFASGDTACNRVTPSAELQLPPAPGLDLQPGNTDGGTQNAAEPVTPKVTLSHGVAVTSKTATG